ncbi:hypothetical protein EDC96DRAFT_130628 [Choanephora cucurbitarum]|nr:hypothetical protein EDC96DRAFT_130516 [Choanephora cucurbitarum]KAI8326905.1 hypothetical protein EDC96DRAFT_130562 [Choanephora cucurbitarum]KAI8326907.1 hypothetical protein EDC96DRAFT_130628 [Choanephora cucurbitarum]
MSAYSYFPTDEQLEERPHLRAHLLQIKELQEKYFSEHPDEDHDEIRLFEAGQCGGPLVAEFHDTIVKLDIRKKKRTRWNQFNSNKREENLSFRNPEHQSLIKAQYQELKADEQMLQLLDQQTEQYNEKIESEAIQTRPLILKKQMKQLKKLCDWLHLNFKTHIALFYATDATELMQRVGCYYNSGIGKQFKSKLFSETGQYPELMLQNMVITEGMNIKRKMEGKLNAVSKPCNPKI